MATPAKAKRVQGAESISWDRDQEIVIERRETIGTVRLSPNGTIDPLTAVFETITPYLRDNLGSVGLTLQWTMFDQDIELIAHPVKFEEPSNAEDALGNPWDK